MHVSRKLRTVAIVFALAIGLAAPARAALFRVDVSGAFTYASPGEESIPVGTPFSGSFDVNTSAAAVYRYSITNVGSVNVVGYQLAAISNVDFFVDNTRFSIGELRQQCAGNTNCNHSVGVQFSEDLKNGGTPDTSIIFDVSPFGSATLANLAVGVLIDAFQPYFDDQVSIAGNRILESGPFQTRVTAIPAVRVPEPSAASLIGVALGLLVLCRLPFRGMRRPS